MGFDADSFSLIDRAEDVLESLSSDAQTMVGAPHLAPDEILARTPNIDPHFIPRAPMSNTNLDVHTLNKLGARGYKRGKEITAQTHPELYKAWVEMSARAGIVPAPQLIVAECDIPNAAAFSKNEVVMTTALLKLLDFREACAVLGHELAHIRNHDSTPDMRPLAILGGPLAVAGGIFAHSGGFAALAKKTTHTDAKSWWVPGQRNPLVAAIGCVFYAALGLVSGLAIARAADVAVRQAVVGPHEFAVDRDGSAFSGDPQALISALNKLEACSAQDPAAAAWRRFQRGYPSNPQRANRLGQLAQTMPLMVRAADNTAEIMPEGPPTNVPKPPMQAVPALQISDVVPAAERVSAQPEAELATI